MASDSLSYSDFGPKRPDDDARSTRPRWWLPPDTKDDASGQTADAIATTVKNMQQRQALRMRQLIIAARLYGNASLLGVSGLTVAQMGSAGNALRERMTDNVIQSVIDTATARIGENKPRPYFLTSGGDYKLQRKAKELNHFTEGIFYENESYEIGGEAQRDAEVFGDGLVFVCERHGRVVHERVLSAEVWVDEAEAVYGRPRQLHWVRAVDRAELAGFFPDSAEEIYDAPSSGMQSEGYPLSQADMVTVRESWHLRSGPKAKDGKHTISIDGHLLDPLTDWPHDFFPFARFRWCPRPMGYWSQGLAEQLQNKQLEVNRLLQVIQRSMHIAGTFKVFLEEGSKIVKEHLNNDIGSIVTYRGTPPTWFVPQVIPPEYYEHYQTIVSTMYERAGVSLQSATGQKPAGLDSGEAQRVYRDTVNERMKTQERLNERAYMDLAEISIAIAREIAEREGHYEVRTPSGRVLKTVRMKASDLDPSDWDMQCFPTSSLPKDPAGRLATIQEYIQAGFMTPRQGRKALDFPDLEAVESLANAAEDLLTKLLDAICDDGDFEPPEPTDDLALAKELVVEYLNRGRMNDLDPARLDLLRTWSSQVDALMEAATPPPAPPMLGPGMGDPMAPPMPMDPSQLVPQVPPGAPQGPPPGAAPPPTVFGQPMGAA